MHPYLGLLLLALCLVILALLFLPALLRPSPLTTRRERWRFAGVRWARRMPFFSAGLALALTACASVQMTAGQTLAAAQTSLAAAATSAHQLYVTGVLSKADIVKIAGWVDVADNVSLTARCAYAAGDNGTVTGALTELATITAAIVAVNTGQTPPDIPPFAAASCANPAPASAVVAQ